MSKGIDWTTVVIACSTSSLFSSFFSVCSWFLISIFWFAGGVSAFPVAFSREFARNNFFHATLPKALKLSLKFIVEFLKSERKADAVRLLAPSKVEGFAPSKVEGFAPSKVEGFAPISNRARIFLLSPLSSSRLVINSSLTNERGVLGRERGSKRILEKSTAGKETKAAKTKIRKLRGFLKFFILIFFKARGQTSKSACNHYTF